MSDDAFASLLRRFTNAAEAGDGAGFAACFTPDAVYHLAALTAVGESWSKPVEYTRVNVLGTKNVLDGASDVVPSATVLLVSSADVYGVVRPEALPLVETFRVAPANPFAAGKTPAGQSPNSNKK